MSVHPDELRSALSAIARVPRLVVAADFDGTIAPIVAHPSDARPIPSAVEALVALASLDTTTVALISGRALRDLKLLSGAPAGVQLVGSHGSEFAEGIFEGVDDSAVARLRKLAEALRTVAAHYPGATVEAKPISVAFHVRNTAPEDALRALDAALAAAEHFDMHLTEGKAVREFAIIRTDKGEALELLRRQADADGAVFFGDDVTDEKAFTRLAPGTDLGVKVGPGDTAAIYRVDTPDDVAAALTFLNDARRRWLSN